MTKAVPFKRFALIGAADYISPRHMLAVPETGHYLVASLDLKTSVVILDSHFLDADLYSGSERFDRLDDRLRCSGNVGIASPSYLSPAEYAQTLTTAVARAASRNECSARRAIAQPAPNGVGTNASVTAG